MLVLILDVLYRSDLPTSLPRPDLDRFSTVFFSPFLSPGSPRRGDLVVVSWPLSARGEKKPAIQGVTMQKKGMHCRWTSGVP